MNFDFVDFHLLMIVISKILKNMKYVEKFNKEKIWE